MLLFLREKQGAQETLHTDQNSNRVHGKEKRKKKGGEIKKRADTNSAIHAKGNREGEKRKETLCVSLSEGPQLPQ